MSGGAKKILVTGANSGIGLALVQRLTTEHHCFCFLGTRDLERGRAAKKSITDEYPDVADQIEVVQLDVSSDASVQAAAATLEAKKDIQLYALVNNAGIVSDANNDAANIMNVNYEGVKRVTKAFVGMMEPKTGRIVNVSSGAACMWLRSQDDATKKMFCEPESVEQIDAYVQSLVESNNVGMMNGYGLSKAALNALTVLFATKIYPELPCVCLSPGYVLTRATKGWGGNPVPVKEGCTSLLKCLFEDVTSGWYYGSDGLRSPMTVTRDPGTPGYQGESNPDPKKYNKE